MRALALAALLVMIDAPADSVHVGHRWCFAALGDGAVLGECLYEADQLRHPGVCAACLEETLGLVRRYEPSV